MLLFSLKARHISVFSHQYTSGPPGRLARIQILGSSPESDSAGLGKGPRPQVMLLVWDHSENHRHKLVSAHVGGVEGEEDEYE